MISSTKATTIILLIGARGKPPGSDDISQAVQRPFGNSPQERTTRGRTRLVTWRAITDGIARPFGRARGTAIWRDGKLQLQFTGPGAHRESATAFIRDGRLICEGITERSRYHTEFRRVDP